VGVKRKIGEGVEQGEVHDPCAGLLMMATPWIDGRGVWRRMRCRFDMVERERQGQEDILCLEEDKRPKGHRRAQKPLKSGEKRRSSGAGCKRGELLPTGMDD
jgi:hypothetical protein